MNTQKHTMIESEKREHTNREIMRASSFLVAQIKKGWTVEEAFEQVENQHGFLITVFVKYYFNKNVNRSAS